MAEMRRFCKAAPFPQVSAECEKLFFYKTCRSAASYTILNDEGEFSLCRACKAFFP